MHSFHLEIPSEVITNDSKEIQYDLIKNKIIVGLCGYSQSGKDSLGKVLVERLSFKRISFADMLKKDLNEYMKNPVFNDLQEKGINIDFSLIDFENPPNIEIKEILRPYMIWYGEEMKKLNGIHHWTNRALSQIDDKDKKVVITDVRRVNELTLFRNNRRFTEKRIQNRRIIEMTNDSPYDINEYDSPFETLLLFVNQLENRDSDSLTKETIITAFEDWLFDDILEIDSRIKVEEFQRAHMIYHVQQLVNKYPKYFV